LTPLFDGNAVTQQQKVLSQKTLVFVADFVIQACVVLTQYSSVTDGWTERQKDGRLYKS